MDELEEAEHAAAACIADEILAAETRLRQQKNTPASVVATPADGDSPTRRSSDMPSPASDAAIITIV